MAFDQGFITRTEQGFNTLSNMRVSGPTVMAYLTNLIRLEAGEQASEVENLGKIAHAWAADLEPAKQTALEKPSSRDFASALARACDVTATEIKDQRYAEGQTQTAYILSRLACNLSRQGDIPKLKIAAQKLITESDGLAQTFADPLVAEQIQQYIDHAMYTEDNRYGAMMVIAEDGPTKLGTLLNDLVELADVLQQGGSKDGFVERFGEVDDLITDLECRLGLGSPASEAYQ